MSARRPHAVQNITTGATAVSTPVMFNYATREITVSATANAYVTWGGSSGAGNYPDATSQDIVIMPGAPREFQANGGEKLSALQVSGSGVVCVEEYV